MTLREWLVLYLKHRDAHARKLQRLTENGDRMMCTYPDHTLEARATETLGRPEGSGKRIIATLNTRENVQFFIDHWQEFSSQQDLIVIFANPTHNEKWLIKPALHARITDGDIAPGIWSIAEGVAYV